MNLVPPRAPSPRPPSRPPSPPAAQATARGTARGAARGAARATAWLLSGGAVGVALTTAAEVLTAPYGEAAAEALMVVNPAVHMLKLVAVIAFAVGLLGMDRLLRGSLARIGRVAIWLLAVTTLAAAGPYSVAEVLAGGSSLADAQLRLDAVYAAQPWIGLLASVALPVILISVVTLAVTVLRRRLPPTWVPVISLAMLLVAVIAGVLNGLDVPVPHPPVWLFLGLAAYGSTVHHGVTSATRRSHTARNAARASDSRATESGL